MSDYSEINREPLRLKGMPLKKKKKKKDKELKQLKTSDLMVDVNKSNATNESDSVVGSSGRRIDEIQLTKAELSFLKKQEKLQMERVLQKAAKSHRQLVEEFNNKLDNMSEHYDIPKVSWTK
ncbi:protein FAM32A-like [Panonychus citri]|uniref:protein FAM32A-like n=1 Tax=Panonychus citri TaxID=50023 RepID=UPI0023072157|nr:protein FAM32A-like [Panonychus citri]